MTMNTKTLTRNCQGRIDACWRTARDLSVGKIHLFIHISRLLDAICTLSDVSASPHRRRALREQLQWNLELAERTVESVHDRASIATRMAYVRGTPEAGPFVCAEACPAGTIEVAGREMAVEAVIAEVEKDRVFFEESGGGMTLSGGEPLARFEFARDLLRSAKNCGLHTAIETCGCAPWPRIEAVAPHTDLFLWDVKDTDSGRHRQATGAPLEPILDNLHRLDAAGGQTRLRCVLIDGFNLDARHLERLAELFHSLGHCQGVELLPYHPMGRSKFERLGRPLPASRHAEPSREVLEAARTRLKEQTVNVIES